MLGKLIKYEFKATYRIFLLLYAALIAISIINMLMQPLDGIASNADNGALSAAINVIQGLFMFGYILLVIAAVFGTIVLIILRFYRNLLGDEGYLMFTLPVKATTHMLSKLITSMTWVVLSTITVLASLLILTVRLDYFDNVRDFFTSADIAGLNTGTLIFGIAITLLISAACYIMMFYAAMSIGPNLTRNRLLGSFLGYIILYAAGQIIGLISVFILFLTSSHFQMTGYSAVSDDQVISLINSIGIGVLIYVNVLNIIIFTGYYLITRHFLKNKINLA